MAYANAKIFFSRIAARQFIGGLFTAGCGR
jgi:hypothetical protein